MPVLALALAVHTFAAPLPSRARLGLLALAPCALVLVLLRRRGRDRALDRTPYSRSRLRRIPGPRLMHQGPSGTHNEPGARGSLRRILAKPPKILFHHVSREPRWGARRDKGALSWRSSNTARRARAWSDLPTPGRWGEAGTARPSRSASARTTAPPTCATASPACGRRPQAATASASSLWTAPRRPGLPGVHRPRRHRLEVPPRRLKKPKLKRPEWFP